VHMKQWHYQRGGRGRTEKEKEGKGRRAEGKQSIVKPQWFLGVDSQLLSFIDKKQTTIIQGKGREKGKELGR